MSEQARFVDAATGWTIYSQDPIRPSHDALNEALKTVGFRPVADRTYTHYKKLDRLGYEDYVSINRLDLRHSNDSVFDIADRSRYIDRPYGDPARLYVPRRSTTDLLLGTIDRVSDGFALFRTNSNPTSLKVSKAIRHNKGVLVFDTVPLERAIEVVESRSEADQILMLLSFRSLLTTDLLFPAEQPESTRLGLRLDLGPEPALAQVVEVVRRTFDLLESARGLVEMVQMEGAQDGNPPLLITPRVEKLSVHNPFDLNILIDPNVLTVIQTVVPWASAQVNKLVGSYGTLRESRRSDERHPHEIRHLTLDNEGKETENEIQKQALKKAELDNQTEALKIRALQLEVGKQEYELSRKIIADIQQMQEDTEPAESQITISERQKPLVEQLTRTAIEMALISNKPIRARQLPSVTGSGSIPDGAPSWPTLFDED